MSQAIVKRRLDYQAPSYLINTVDLVVHLEPTETLITSTLAFEVPAGKEGQELSDAPDLILDGENLSLRSIALNGKVLNDAQVAEGKLIIQGSVLAGLTQFTLLIENTIDPQNNASLEGLYLSNGAYCTQCEAEGFRKISYFLDRPDILSIYTVTIIADKDAFPHILSNGNLIERRDIEPGKTFVKWHDPFKKPCYLFALVAGDFDKLSDSFTTMSGREVALELYVDKGKASQGAHALNSLKKSMKWDEDTYGLEYDLDVYMIVAVDFFNMGAMENKGLNVFNSKYVLADSNTATDDDFFNIESIIGHEYFHNWTGNRVTCRDWFQLSLKEGLTVFRDQQFSADMFSYLATRISQVKVMRTSQFAEDASPMSHPIRPDEVIEMNNFYTVTVYDKGAEVIRMMHTLLGANGFRQGMDLYFSRHDAQAVTCDDFVNAMQDANDVDLSHFKLWYSQSGTPRVSVDKEVDNQRGVLRFHQMTEATPDQSEKQALYLPIKIECLDPNGNKIDVNLSQDTFVLDKASAVLAVPSVNFVPVLLSDFSSPVILDYPYTLDELALIMSYSSSDYSRWDSSQAFYTALITELYHTPATSLSSSIWQQLRTAFIKAGTNYELLNEMLTIPSVETLIQGLSLAQPLKLSKARTQFIEQMQRNLNDFLQKIIQSIEVKSYAYAKQQVNERRLISAAIMLLSYSKSNDVSNDIANRFTKADNMTDKLNMLKCAQICNQAIFAKLMLQFEDEYGDNAVVMDKWFALHATVNSPDVLAQLTLLASHQQFNIKNPNKVRSLVGSFAFFNTDGFHALDGGGYQYLTDYLIELDKINPQVASRLVTPLIQFKKFSVTHQELMKVQLNRLLARGDLSKDVYEKVSKSLTT